MNSKNPGVGKYNLSLDLTNKIHKTHKFHTDSCDEFVSTRSKVRL